MKVLLLTNMYPTPECPAFGSFVRDQVEFLRKEGVEIDVLQVNGTKNKLNYLWGILHLWARLLARRYDIIHAHYVFSGLIARTQFLYPVVLTHHGLEVFTGWQRFPSRLITHLVDKIILVSREQREKLGCHQAEIIPCGIDLDLFSPMSREEARRKLNLPPFDRKLVLFAGATNRPEKRFDIVKTAITLAQERDPMIELVQVSGKPHNIMPLYMNACDVLLLVSNAEGSPVAIKEAMACNLPIVSVPAGDVAEIISDTEGCYLCSQDAADVAEKLGLVLKHTQRTNGREQIKHLAQSSIAKRIAAVYQEVLCQKKGRFQTSPVT